MNTGDGAFIAIGAHADDIELHAGGWAARAAEAGRPVHFVMVTNNISGNLLRDGAPDGEVYCLPPEETRAVRHREQQAAADLIGATMHWLDYPQRHYWAKDARHALDFRPDDHDPYVSRPDNKPPLVIAAQKDEHIDAVGDLLVSLKPSVVVTQTITDIDPEHHATASLVWQAFQRRRGDLPGASLLFWAPGTSSMAGMLRQSFDHVAPFGQDHFETKMRMLRCHASQMTPRRLEMSERRARYWGAEIGAEFAEPFTTVFNALGGRD